MVEMFNLNLRSICRHFSGNTTNVLRKNLSVARATVQDFHAQFGYPKSNTFVQLKIYKHRQDSAYSQICQSLEAVLSRYAEAFEKVKADYIENIRRHGKPLTMADSVDCYSKSVLDNRTANCDLQSLILREKLRKNGVRAKNIGLTIRSKSTNKERKYVRHFFNVVGMKRFARINNPKSWGKNAVVADTWSHICEPAEIGIEYLKDVFGFNPDTEYIQFHYNDFIRFLRYRKDKRYLKTLQKSKS